MSEADGEAHTHDQQQELFLLVHARLAALQDGRAGVRRGTDAEQRPVDARRAAAPYAVVPRSAAPARGLIVLEPPPTPRTSPRAFSCRLPSSDDPDSPPPP